MEQSPERKSEKKTPQSHGFSDAGHTPWKIKMEPKNGRFGR